MSDYLGKAFPRIADRLRKRSFASLPTPISHHFVSLGSATHGVAIKHDDQTSQIYGGNKVRKLEYIFQRAKDRGAERVATFGAVGSNHALATAIHAKELGLECTCFLAHQKRTPNIPITLDKHLSLGTKLVRYGGGIDHLELFRRHLHKQRTWVIPLGGTCWLGAVGFINAGLELAAQINAGDLKCPDRIYIANGTMGSVAGLALGLVLANLPTEIHAIRVADNRFARPDVLTRLIEKSATLLRRLDPSVPIEAAAHTNVIWRDDFFAGGYAAVDDATANAVTFAKENLDLNLETTYTGKAMAAMLHDLRDPHADHSCLFWNTYYSKPIAPDEDEPRARVNLPDEFQRYYQAMDS